VPRRKRLELAESLEARMRSSNPAFKADFPEPAIRSYAAAWLAGGHDAVVLGHFHVEREIDEAGPGRRGKVYVLPEWKGSRRCLRVGRDGTVGFRDC
jgi:hypothetical protein